MIRKLLALLLCAAIPVPAIAQTHVIAELGTAPLVGQVASTEQLQADVSTQRELFAAAGRGLGLTPAEFARFQERIARRQLSYVTIPRRLDAMSWRSGDRVHVLHDVLIPANTRGWEVDLLEHGQILALFIPNKCGNLSLLRRPAPALARAAAPAPPVQVAAAETAAPAPSPTPVETPAPVSTPAPYASVASSTGPAHHLRLWPLLLLLPVVAMLTSHGSSSAPVNLTPQIPLVPAAPTPPPVIGCPTPAPH